MAIAESPAAGKHLLVTIAAGKAKKGHWKEALNMARMMDEEPTKAEMLITLGQLLAKVGKKADAANLFQDAGKIVDKLPKRKVGQLSYSLILALQDAGDIKAALKRLESIKADSKIESYFQEDARVKVYCATKQFPQALRHARLAAEKMPGNESAFWRIASTQAEAGDFKPAQATLDEMKIPDFKAYALMDISKVHLKNGNREKAVSSLKEAMELTDKVPEARITFAFSPGKAYAFYKTSLALTEAGEAATARAWLARQISPHWQAWGYVGVAEGLLQKRGKKQ